MFWVIAGFMFITFNAEFTRRNKRFRICQRKSFIKFIKCLLMKQILKSLHLLRESGDVVVTVQWMDQLIQITWTSDCCGFSCVSSTTSTGGCSARGLSRGD